MSLSNEDLQAIATLLKPMQDSQAELNKRITSLETHIENTVDKNIQLLAENFIELTKKLNQVIPIVTNNYTYEIKVNYLTEEVDKLKKEIAELKSKIA